MTTEDHFKCLEIDWTEQLEGEPMSGTDVLKEISQKNKKLKRIRHKMAKALIEADMNGKITISNISIQKQVLALVSDVPLKISVLKTILDEARKHLEELTQTYIKDMQERQEKQPKTATGMLSEAEAARILGVHKETLARQRRARTGPAFTQVGKRILYSQEALEEYVKKHTT
jgi:DNA-binding protein YbaB